MSYHPNALGFMAITPTPAMIEAAKKAAAEAKAQADIVSAGKLAAVGLAQTTSYPMYQAPSSLPGWVVPVGILAAVGVTAFFMLRK